MKYNNIKISNRLAHFVILDKHEYNIKVEKINNLNKYIHLHKQSIIINGGLFDSNTYEIRGQLIINHNIVNPNIMNYDMNRELTNQECYPLIIDDKNMFILSEDRYSRINNAKNLKMYNYALCGWGALIINGKDNHFADKEKVWGHTMRQRQVIGTIGDKYFILTCENAYYKDIVDFLLEQEVDFAYSLDGGHSSKLYINGKKINKVIGRKFIPTIIEFYKEK